MYTNSKIHKKSAGKCTAECANVIEPNPQTNTDRRDSTNANNEHKVLYPTLIKIAMPT